MLTNSSAERSTDWLTKKITDFVNTSPLNNLGFSRGDDPIYFEFNKHIGEFYWTLLEIFHLTFPSVRAKQEDLWVISWILPQTRTTKDENAIQRVYPSLRWAAARDLGEKFNVSLRQNLVNILLAETVQAVAPMLLPHWSHQTSQIYGLASNWSERHAAHAGGLGTFGLCDGLITPLGKAIRAGSVVARIEVAPTPRPYKDHHAYCLYYSHGTCQKCVERCPMKAIISKGHDKTKCSNYLETSRKHIERTYGNHKEGCCGLCQAGVLCESHIPAPGEG